MPTFGETTYNNQSGIGLNYISLSRATLSDVAMVTKLSTQFHITDAAVLMRMVLYSAGDTYTPINLLATSNEVQGIAPGWIDYPLATSLLLQPGDYYVGIHTNTLEASSIRSTDAVGKPDNVSKLFGTYPTIPDPWNTSGQSTNAYCKDFTGTYYIPISPEDDSMFLTYANGFSTL